MSRLPPELRRKAKNKYGYGCRTGKRRYTSHSAAYNDMLAVNTLTEFYPAPDTCLQLGSANTALASGQNVPAPGVYRGYHSAGIEVREWASWLAGYVGAFSSGGLKPLALREDELAQLQGFVPIADREDFPYLQRIFQRKAGIGAYNRVGAAVRRVSNATYAIPSGHTAPVA